MGTTLAANVGTKSLTIDTNYIPVFGTTSEDTTTEANTHITVRVAGTSQFRFLRTFCTSNSVSGGSTAIALRKNSGGTAQSVSYAASQTGIKIDTGSAESAGSNAEINYRVVLGDTGPFVLESITMSHQSGPSNNFNQRLNARGPSTLTAINDFYSAMNGFYVGGVTLEGPTKFTVGDSFNASKLQVNISANTLGGGDTFISFGRVNGVNGNMSVSYSSGQTGIKEDIINSDSLVATDDFNYLSTLSNTITSVVIEMISCNFLFVGSSSLFPLMASHTSGVSVGSNTTTYCGISGDLIFNTTETDLEAVSPFNFIAKKLGSHVTVNSLGATTTVHFRDNRADGNMSISYTTGQTGTKSDNTNTDSVTGSTSGSAGAGDEINYKVVTPGPLDLNSITFAWIGLGANESLANDQLLNSLTMIGVGT